MPITALFRRRAHMLASTALALALAACAHGIDAADPSPAPPSLAGFDDAIHHWKNAHGPDEPRYAPGQVREIADNILLMQRDHGGWVQNQDPTLILSEELRARIRSQASGPEGSFDNRNVYTQVAYLMAAHEQLGDERYRAAAMRGLDYLLAHQIATCGGWPHSLPGSAPYHPMITVADEVFSGPLGLLRDISERRAPFASLDDAVQQRASLALERGENCLLRLQVRQDGVPTGWAGQYDPVTLAPAMGRTFELPSIATEETGYILSYLMSIEAPAPEVVASVEGGVAWLRSVAISGTRLVEVPLPVPVRLTYHTATHDRRLVADADAPPLWARFYDLNDNSVVLANRDSRRVERYADISLERRTGYHWYGVWGTAVLDDYAAWKARLGDAG